MVRPSPYSYYPSETHRLFRPSFTHEKMEGELKRHLYLDEILCQINLIFYLFYTRNIEYGVEENPPLTETNSFIYTFENPHVQLGNSVLNSF